MVEFKILTPKDAKIIPAYVGLLHEGLDEIAGFYSGTEIADARSIYTPNYVYGNLVDPSEKRFIGAFDGRKLEGVLIESFDRPQVDLDRTSVNWIVSKTKGQGVGTALVRDCVARAIAEKKDYVSLAVAEKNPARRLYEREGFEPHGSQVVNGVIDLHYVINRAKMLGEIK